jgi:hypothetical protein
MATETETATEETEPEPHFPTMPDAEVDPRAATTWYAPNQQCVHADTLGPARVYAAGANAGIPGAWTPAGAVVPATQLDVMQGKPVPIVASPGTAWTTGQFVQTATAGAPGRVCWTGSAWVGGAAP